MNLIMAEAPIHWKVKLLKEIRDGVGEMSFIPEQGTNDLEWFKDMKRDGLVCGDWGTIGTLEEAIKQNSIIPTGGKSGFHFVTERNKTGQR
jgi:hypothetical protein